METGREDGFQELKEKYKDVEVLSLSIYMDELLEPVKKAFMRLSGVLDNKKEDNGGFTSIMNRDAEYRDEN